MEKYIFNVLGMLFLFNVVSAQKIAITEIMYNPPEAGTDSLDL